MLAVYSRDRRKALNTLWSFMQTGRQPVRLQAFQFF